MEKFLSLPTWKPVALPDEKNRLIAPTAEVEIEAVTAVQNLANTVIANAASRSLARFVSIMGELLVLTFPKVKVEARDPVHFLVSRHDLPRTPHHVDTSLPNSCAKVYHGDIQPRV